MDTQVIALEKRVAELENFIQLLQSSGTFPIRVQEALTGRGFIKVPRTLGPGVVRSNGDGTFTVIVGTSGSFYAATISGGSPTLFVDFGSGLRTT